MAEDNKNYYVQLPDKQRGEIWDAQKYERNQQKLFSEHPDAIVLETSPYSGEDNVGDNGFYFVHLPGYGKAEMWDAAKFERNKDKLMQDHPDVSIAKGRMVDYWGDKLNEDEKRASDNEKRIAEINQYFSLRNTALAGGDGPFGVSSDIITANNGMDDDALVRERQTLGKENESIYKEINSNPKYKAQQKATVDAIDNEILRLYNLQLDEDKRSPKLQTAGTEVEFVGAQLSPEQQRLATASRWLKDAKTAAEAPGRYDDSNGFANFGRGMIDNAGHIFTLVDLNNAIDDTQLMGVIKKVQQQEGDKANIFDVAAKSPAYLSSGENELLKAFVTKSLVDYSRAEGPGALSRAYQAGDSSIRSIGFMKDMFVTGGLGDAASAGLKGFARAIAKKGTQAAAQQAAESAVKGGAKAATKKWLREYGTDLLESAVKTAVTTPFQPSAYSNAIDNLLTIDENGGVDLSGRAVVNAGLDAMVEVFSEHSGDRIMKVLGLPFKGAGTVAGKIGGTKVGDKILRNTPFADWAKAIQESAVTGVMKQAGWHGLIGEMGEEWYGNAIRQVTGIDPQALTQFATWDQQLITLMSFAPMSLLGAGGSAAQAIRSGRTLKGASEKLDKFLSESGYDEDKIRDIHDAMTNAATPEEISRQLSAIGSQVVSDNEENRVQAYRTIMDYAKALSEYKVQHNLQDIDTQERRQKEADTISEELGDGNSFELADGNVRVLTDSDGRQTFVNAVNEDGTLAVVTRDETGTKVGFMSPEELEEKTASGELADSGVIGRDEFLDREIARKNSYSETLRMNEERQERLNTVQEAFSQGDTINVGTEENPSFVNVMQVTPDGLVVMDETGTARMMPIEDAAKYAKVSLDVLTDEQRDEQEATALEVKSAVKEAVRDSQGALTLERDGEKYTINRVLDKDGSESEFTALVTDKDGNETSLSVPVGEVQMLVRDWQERESAREAAAAEEVQTIQDESEMSQGETPATNAEGNETTADMDEGDDTEQSTLLPMRTNKKGEQVVDEKTLWNENPERWCEYNDANPSKVMTSDEMLAANVKELDRKIKAVEKERKAAQVQMNLDKLDDLNDSLGQLSSRRSALVSIQRKRQEIASEERGRKDEEAIRRRDEARKAKAEQLARYNTESMEDIRRKWTEAPKETGAADELVLNDGTSIKGHYVLTEAYAPTASHDTEKGFAKTEGFPVDANGRTVNDRDYEHDKAAQVQVEQKAAAYDQRALQTPVVVSQDGIVLSGNDRTMASQLAARNGTDGRYVGYLSEHARKYGFTTEQVSNYVNPRVLFVLDEAMPYDAATFARFNADERKSQSRTESAVKAGKTLAPETVTAIAQVIDRYDSIAEVYADPNAVNEILSVLVNAGNVEQNRVESLRDGDRLSGTGEDLVESILLGAVMREDALRCAMEDRSIRRSIMSALAQLVSNGTFGEYSLAGEFSDAVVLLYQAKQSGLVKGGESIANFMSQPVLEGFGENPIAAATVQMIANTINGTKVNGLKNVLSLYNAKAEMAASGQANLFLGAVETKEQIIREILDEYGYNTETFAGERQRPAAAAGQQSERGSAEEQAPDAVSGDAGSGAEEVVGHTLLDAVKVLYSKGKEYASKIFQRSFFDVTETPEFMRELGLDGEKFTIKYGVISRHLSKDGSHAITEQEWEQLPEALQHPFAISKLTDRSKGYRIYTTLQTGNGEYIVVGVDVKNAGRDIEVNSIVTVFGRRENANLSSNEEVIYRSNEITPEQSSLLGQPNSDQYPTEWELSGNSAFDNTMDTDETLSDKRNDTATPQNTVSSDDKATQSSETKQENGGLSDFATEIYNDTLSGLPEGMRERVTVRESSTGDEAEENFVQSYDLDGKPSGISRVERFDAKPNENPTRFVIDGSDVDAPMQEQERWQRLADEYRRQYPQAKVSDSDEMGINFTTFKEALEFLSWADYTEYTRARAKEMGFDERINVSVSPEADYLGEIHGYGENQNIQAVRAKDGRVFYRVFVQQREDGHFAKEELLEEAGYYDNPYSRFDDLPKHIEFDTYDEAETFDRQVAAGKFQRTAAAKKPRSIVKEAEKVSQARAKKSDEETVGKTAPEFSISGNGKSLLGVHNISADKLSKAIKLGGLANPSAAVIDVKRQAHSGYGEISLILPPSMIDSKTGKNMGTWFADAWTATYPAIKRMASDDGRRQFSADILNVPEDLRPKIRQSLDGWIDDKRLSDGLAYLFLLERGIAPQAEKYSSGVEKEVADKILEIMGDKDSFAFLDKEAKGKALELYLKSTGRTRQEYADEMSSTIRRLEDSLSDDAVPHIIRESTRRRLDWLKTEGYEYEVVKQYVNGIVRDARRDGETDVTATLGKANDIIRDSGLEDEYARWADALDDRYGVEEQLFGGWKNDGSPRYVPNTLENASRLMRKAGGAGAEGIAVNFNHLVATLAPKGKSLDAIRKRKGNLSSKEEYDEFFRKWNDKVFDLAIQISYNPDDRWDDSGFYRLEEVAQKSDPRAFLRREYNVEVSDEWLKTFNDFKDAVKKDYPAKYFETKFARPVKLEEFAAAVVPSDLDGSLKDTLEGSGIRIYEYEPDNEDSRKEATIRAAEETNALFQATTKALSNDTPERRLAFDTVSQMLSEAGVPVERLSDVAMRQMAENASMLDTALPEEDSSFKGTVMSSIDGAKILKDLDNAISRYEENTDNRPTTFLGDAAKALGAVKHGSNSQYATFETKNGEVFTIRIADHNAKVSTFDKHNENRGISIVVSRKPNGGIQNDGKAHITEFFYPDKALSKADGKPLVEILKSIKQSPYSGEYRDTTGLAQVEEVNADSVPELMTVYHGSGAKFDQFDHSHMGEGEGNQSYGWGTYVTEVEGIGKSYARANVRTKYKGESYDDVTAKAQLGIAPYNSVSYIMAYMKFGSDFADAKEAYREKLKDKIDYYEKNGFLRFAEEDRKELAEVDSLNESDFAIGSEGRNLYTVEIPENRGNNYLEWDKRINETGTDILTEIGNKLWGEEGWHRVESGGLTRFTKGEETIVLNPNATGADIYEELSVGLGGPKAASEFLNSLDYVGISYPAEYMSGGRSDGARNYVIFDENNAKITDRIEFLKDGDVVYGAAVGGKIFLNADRLNPNTPIHEYTHLWDKACKARNPELWKRGVELMKQTALWKEVENDPNYAGLDEDGIAGEVHARLTGDRGEETLERMSREVLEDNSGVIDKAARTSVIRKLREWLSEFWHWVKDTMTPWSREEAEKVSIDDFINMSLADLAKGTRLDIDETGGASYSIVTDKDEIDRLDSEPTMKAYRAMQLVDGRLYPPMSGKVNGKWRDGIAVEDLGKVWEKADENPELADDKGMFTLNKGNGTTLKARYNPYIHTSTTPLNDQFSSAQSRPELVTVEVEIPESELTSGYKADKAKDSVGKVEWKAGAVQGKLSGTRTVILSRWDKPMRIVPESEVADRIVEMFDGKEITMPSNVVTPALRAELERRGVPFVETDNQGKPVETTARFREDSKSLFKAMQDNAEVLTPRQLTKEIWDEEVKGKTFTTPIGGVRLGANQYSKNIKKGREKEFGMLIPTIERPDIIFEESAPEQGAERQTKYAFVKTFVDENGRKHLNYTSISVRKDDMEVVESSHFLRDKQVLNKIEKEQMLWNRFASDSALSAQGGSTVQSNALSSTAKIGNESEKTNESVENRKYRGEVQSDSPVSNYGRSIEGRRETAVKTAESLGMEIEVVDSSAFPKGHEGAKGMWRDGKVYVCPENHTDADDVTRTVLHEAVGHRGLRRLVGERGMDTFCSEIYRALPESERRRIAERAMREYRGDFAEATEEYLAEAAESGEFLKYDDTVWDRIRAAVRSLLGRIGINVPLSKRDVQWLLWQSYNAGSGSVVTAARRQSLARRLGFSLTDQKISSRAKDGIRYRKERQERTDSAAAMYNNAVTSWRKRLHESYVDMYNSVAELTDAVEKQTGKTMADFENVNLALNQQSSKELAAISKWERDCYNPMWDAIKEVMGKVGCSQEDVGRYALLKHGLERNAVLAARDARDYYRRAYEKQTKAIRGNENLSKDEKDRRVEEAKLVYESRLKDIEDGTDGKLLKLRERDYGGITAMYRKDADGVRRLQGESEEEFQRRKNELSKPLYENVADAEAAAREEVGSFERKAGRDSIDNLWERVNKATKTTLKHQFDANMLSRKQYETVRDMFLYYVPMRGFADNIAEDMYSYYTSADRGNGFTAPLVKARGRKTKAESPWGYIGAMASSAYAADEKNNTKLALYYFISNRPENDLATISDVWYRKTGMTDADGKDIYEPVYPEFRDGLDSDAAKAEYDKWQQDMEELQKKGEAFEGTKKLDLKNSVVHIDKSHEASHIIRFKVGGEDKMMFINGNPRAAQAINNMLNVDASTDAITRGSQAILRWMSGFNTSYNPAFWISNAQRDLLFSIMAVNVKEGGEYSADFVRNFGKAVKAVTMVRKDRIDGLGDSYVERMYKEFKDNGGVTGFTVLKDNEEWEKMGRKMIADRNKAGQRAMSVLESIQDFGEGIEQMTRFAAYMTSRERGKSVQQSVSDAKELTVNFNRKGSGKTISWKESANLTYEHKGKTEKLNDVQRVLVVGASLMSGFGRRAIMFFNASVQGLNTMYKLWEKDHRRTSAWIGGYFALGVINALLHGLLDDDDDYLDMPDYERRNNLMLGGKGYYMKWALPQEARMFFAMGDIIVNQAMGRMPHKKAFGLFDVLEAIGDVMPINPLNGWRGVLPQVAIPIAENLQNEDYKGAKIYPDMKYLSDDEQDMTPKFSYAYSNTGKAYVFLSQVLNRVTGGDDYNAGWLNVHPESIEHLVGGYFGGLATTLNQTGRTLGGLFKTAFDVANGVSLTEAADENLSIRSTPFLNRVLVSNDERYRNAHTTDVFNYYKANAEHTRRVERQMINDDNYDALDKLYDSKEYEEMQIYESYKGIMDYYTSSLREAESNAEKRELMAEQDEYRKEMIEEIANLK